MALPSRNERHAWLRFNTQGYTNEEIQDFKARDITDRLQMEHTDAEGYVLLTSYAWRTLLGIRGPLVREVILEFFCTLRQLIAILGLHTVEEMETDGFRAYWDASLRVIASKAELAIIGSGFLLVVPEKATTTDLFYLRSMDEGTTMNESLQTLTVEVYGLTTIDIEELSRLRICERLRDVVPQIPQAAAPILRTIPQRLHRLEEDVHSNNSSVDVHSNSVSSNNATTSNSLISCSNEQSARLMNLLNENGVSTANANMVVGNINLGWIVNSGANHHMTVSAKKLINVVDISNLGLTVGHPNGTQALITKIGDLKITNDITLYDVLVVLEYTFSLHSIHKLSRDRRVSSNDDGIELSPDIQGNDDCKATFLDENNTHPEGTVPNETDFVNDFYENSEFNYEVEDLLVQAVNNNWIDAMNAETEALNKHQT
nr:ribonuclease H-like domain-containing protein [Tanacetum cinerariifolium]